LASLAESLLEFVLCQKCLKLSFVGGFAEVNGAEIFEIGLDILHQSTEPVPLFIECEQEVDAAILGQFSLCDLQGFGLVWKDHEAGAENDHVKEGLGLLLLKIVVVHVLDFNVWLVFEELLAGRDIMYVVVDAENSCLC